MKIEGLYRRSGLPSESSKWLLQEILCDISTLKCLNTKKKTFDTYFVVLCTWIILNVSNISQTFTVIHTLMAAAALQAAVQHIRSSLWFSISAKDTSSCRPGELNLWTYHNKTLALPLSHSCTDLEIYVILGSVTVCLIWSPVALTSRRDLGEERHQTNATIHE